MESPFFETSFLVTKADYVNMELERKKYQTPKENRVIFYIIGIIAVCCGTAAFMNLRNSVYQTICWVLLIVIGLYVMCYYDIIRQAAVRKQALGYYEIYKKSVHSKSVRIDEERFQMKSEERSIDIPKKYIYRIVEGKYTVFIFLDRNEYCFLPKRLFSQEQLDKLTSLDKGKTIRL